MICLALSPAIDVTYRLGTMRPGEVNRVERVEARAGGKAVNVARVARALGASPTVVAPAGGADGRRLVEELRAESIRVVAVPVEAEMRRTVTVVTDTGHPTGLYEPATRLEETEWRLLGTRAVELAGEGPLVISGSLPSSVRPAELERLVSRLRESGATVVVDVSGSALPAAASGGASVLKPNVDELRQATGERDWRLAARLLLGRGAGSVLVSLGAEGLAYCTQDRVVHTRRVPEVTGNPTGAGDAVVAALALARAQGLDAVETVRRCAATGAAAVVQPVAGVVDPMDVERYVVDVTVEDERWP